MRIIGGTLGGRRFQPPARIPARPTTDLAREGLFNILQNLIDIDGISALDLFAGTGGVSYELASRGAAQVCMVEQDSTTVAFLKKTIKELDIETQVQIVRGDVFKFLAQCRERFDLVFADPPYALPDMDALPELVLSGTLLGENGLFVLEHGPRNNYERHPHCFRTKKYGDTFFSFFKKTAND